MLSGPTWAAFLRRLPPALQVTLDAVVPLPTADAAAQPAHTALKAIRGERAQTALFFYIDAFLEALEVKSMRGKEWLLPLVGGRVPVCDADELVAACAHPRRAWLVPTERLQRVGAEEYAAIKASLQVAAVAAPRWQVARLA